MRATSRNGGFAGGRAVERPAWVSRLHLRKILSSSWHEVCLTGSRSRETHKDVHVTTISARLATACLPSSETDLLHGGRAALRHQACDPPRLRGGTARGLLLAALLSATAFVPVDRAAGQGWSDPVTTTPSFIQKQFGPYGGVLPGEGEQYCGPVATAMGLYYLGLNGYTQHAVLSASVPRFQEIALAAFTPTVYFVTW